MPEAARILVLSYEFPPLGGGGAKVVHGLVAELARMGHEIDLVTTRFRRAPLRERVGSASVYRVASLRLRGDRSNAFELACYLAWASSLLARLMRHRRFDLCHAHFAFPDGVLACVLHRVTGLPYIITVHGSDVPGYNPDRFTVLHRILRPIWRKVVVEAECVVCPSKTLSSLVRANEGRARTVVVPNGFDPGRLEPGRPKYKVVLAVSRLFERKGLQYLIEAFSDLDTDYELQIVGDGPYRAALEARAAARGSEIRFCGWLDNQSPELADRFERASIFVLPSEAENFPVSLLEAMAAGSAIITTSGTGCADVVGDTALLTPPRDVAALRAALQRLVEDDELRRDLGARARARVVENFTWDAVARRYAEIYRECAGRALYPAKAKAAEGCSVFLDRQ
jgi:glycosyltransferase involved in cell wall biosynthesis